MELLSLIAPMKQSPFPSAQISMAAIFAAGTTTTASVEKLTHMEHSRHCTIPYKPLFKTTIRNKI